MVLCFYVTNQLTLTIIIHLCFWLLSIINYETKEVWTKQNYNHNIGARESIIIMKRCLKVTNHRNQHTLYCFSFGDLDLPSLKTFVLWHKCISYRSKKYFVFVSSGQLWNKNITLGSFLEIFIDFNKENNEFCVDWLISWLVETLWAILLPMVI